MNDSHHDAIFRAALTPRDDVHAPVTLADEIHQALLATPQQSRPITQRIGWLRLTPALSPATLLLLLLAMATLVAGAAILLTRVPRPLTGVVEFRGDPGRTGAMDGPAPRTHPIVGWEAQLPRQLSVQTMPLVAEGMVYIIDVRGNALALDLASGRERWSVAFPADVSGTPLISGDLLVAPADDGIVRALSLQHGETAWTTDLGARLGSTIGGSGDLALVGADDGKVHALDVRSGQERWSVDVGGPVAKVPAIEDGIAHVVADGKVTAFDAETGAVQWRFDDLSASELATPVVRDGVLYLARRTPDTDEPGEIIALDVGARGGPAPRELWRWRAPVAGEMSVGAVASGAVYAISSDGNVYAIDPATGLGEVYLTTGGHIGSPMSVVRDTLYVGSQDGRVYAVDRGSREILWSMEIDGRPMGPVAADGRLIVGTELGQLVSLVEAPHASPR
jgi:outer membrane protein assembly factor BamB